MRTSRYGFFSRALPVAALCAASALAACSSAPATVETPPGPSASVAAPGNAGRDLSPVPAPAGIFASGRAKSVRATLATLGLSGAENEVATAAIKETLGAHGLRLDVDPARAATVVALDAPVDFVAAMAGDGPPDPVVAVAIGLKSLEEAKTALGATREFAPGMWAMGGERAKGFCVVAASSGPTPARAVCGPSERDVQALAPYLTRTVTLQNAAGSDANLELDVSSLNARFGKDAAKLATQAPRLAKNELGIGDPQWDKAIETGAKGLTDEALAFLGDLDKVRFDVTLSQQGGVTLEGSMDYKSQNSWMAKTTAQAIVGAPPPLFFRAPSDADSVGFGTIRDPGDYAPIIKVGKDLVEGGLTKAKVGTDAERKKISALLDFPMSKGEQFVTASGTRLITKPAEGKSISEKMAAFMKNSVGWTLVGSTQKADTVSKWLRDSAAAFNQPGVQKIVKQELPNAAFTVKTPAAPAKLGSGAFALELTFPGPRKRQEMPAPPMKGGGKKPAPKPASESKATFSVYVLVMADGDASWVAFGANKDELVERLLEVKAGAAKEKLLESRADVQGLKQLKVTTGGFITLRSFHSLLDVFLLSSTSTIDGGDVTSPPSSDDSFAKLPNKGETPIVYQGSVVTSPLRTKVTLNVPKGSIDDVTALVKMFRR